jgi:hypothetical protein
MSEENKAVVRRMIDELLNGQGNLDVADELPTIRTIVDAQQEELAKERVAGISGSPA